MHCSVCDKDVQPITDMGSSMQLVIACPSCGVTLGVPESHASPPKKPDPEKWGAPELVGPRLVDTIGKARVHSGPQDTVDIIAEARKRLEHLDNELARLSAIQRERRKLAAMIAVADAADEAELQAAAE